MTRIQLLVSFAAALSLSACGSGGGATAGSGGNGGSGGATGSGASGGSGGAGGVERPPVGVDTERDILTTALSLDMTTLEATATLTLAPSVSKAASFEVGDLEILSVSDSYGPLEYAVSSSRLDVGVPSLGGPGTLTVAYRFKPHADFDGWMPASKVSFLWPYFCGNLFPCKSSPADGVTFSMAITGVPAGLTAIYPESIPADAPSYMPAIALGEYTKVDLGKTAKGTSLVAHHLPGQEAATAAGTAHLRDVFDFFEQTYGAYTFGPIAGSVSADWGPGDFGGMEHHPYWHVGKNDFADEITHAHEAAHGWFGDGVRIECWEDFVLSEGTVSYMAAHALEELGVDAWSEYACELRYVCDPANMANTIALPSTCNAIDLLHDPLWSSAPYMKGAYFFREVAKLIGPALLDQALSEFYQAKVGKAARMADLVDQIASKTDAAGKVEVVKLAKDWLLTLGCPVDFKTLCP